MQRERPNILLITTDMQRYDTLGCYGNPAIRTPNVDRLARQGVLFTHAFANNPVCMPARATLFTGKLPSAHGVQWNSGGLARHEVTVTRRLREAGYQTAAIGKMHWGESEADFGLEYLNVTDHGEPASPGVKNYRATLQEAGLYPPPRPQDVPGYREYYGAVTSPLPFDYHLDTFIGRATVEFLRRRDRSRPFFCWCSFFGPHLPIDPAPPWDRLYDPDDVPLPVWEEGEFDTKPPEQRAFQRNERRGNGFGDYRRITHDMAKLRRFIAFYWGKISMIDHVVGEVLRALEETGEADRTIVVFTTDHGDFAGNHRLLFKSAFLYDDLVRIPLVITHPGWRPGQTVDALVEQIDLPVTMLSWAGLKPHPGVQGEDLSRLFASETGAYVGAPRGWREAAYAEAVDKRMLRTREWKLVHYAGRPYGELYHLTEDPHELRNRYGDPDCRGVSEALQRALLDRVLAMQGRLHPEIDWLELDDPLHPGDPARRVRLPFI